jgi:hypothetical protein
MVNENKYIEKINQTRNLLDTFQKAKASILSKKDLAIMKNGLVTIKRSGWRKIAMVFGLSLKIVSIEKTFIGKEEDRHLIVEARVIAKDNLGREQEEVGICDWTEFIGNSKLKGTIHNITTKAITRAYNRAISNMVGGGEVSAEEIDISVEDVTSDISELEIPDEIQKEINQPLNTKENKTTDKIDNSTTNKDDVEEMDKYLESF